MSKYSEEQYIEYDKLFYEFILFLNLKIKDLENYLDSINDKNMFEYSFNTHIKINFEDSSFTYFTPKEIIKLNIQQDFLECDKTIQIVNIIEDITKNSKYNIKIKDFILFFNNNEMKLLYESVNKLSYQITRKKITEDYKLSFNLLNNFDKLWRVIFNYIKEQLENE